MYLLHVPKDAEAGFSGNAIVVSSTTAVVIALTWGGTVHPWSSAQVVVPLVLGLLGLMFFVAYEAIWATNPIVGHL